MLIKGIEVQDFHFIFFLYLNFWVEVLIQKKNKKKKKKKNSKILVFWGLVVFCFQLLNLQVRIFSPGLELEVCVCVFGS